MKAFVAVSALLAAAAADQSSHQVIHGHGAPVHHAPVHVAPVHAPVAVKVAPVVPVVAHPAPAPYHAPAPAPYHAPKPVHGYKEPAYDEPAAYAYEYGVADDYSKATFSQNEARDGYATHGEYRVALPDGRTQIVTYRVDDAYGGYVADVKYEGVAQYPEYKPTYKPAPKPAYHA